ATVLRWLPWHLWPWLYRGPWPGAGAISAIPLHQHEERTRVSAYRRRVRQNEQPTPDLRVCEFHRTRRDQYGDGRRAGHDQPFAGAAAARRHLRPAQCQPGASATRTTLLSGYFRQ